MSKVTLVAILLGAGFLALLVYSTMGLQAVSCEVCMQYNGRDRCATTSAPSKEEALRTGRDTACAPITFGMTETIQCGNTEPVSFTCDD